MGGQYRYCGNGKAIGGIVILGFLVAGVSCEVGGLASSCCLLLEGTGWVTFEVARSIVLQVVRQVAWAYLYQDSGLLHHLLQIGASLSPLLCRAMGRQ